MTLRMTEHAVHMGIRTETCIHDLKNVNLQHYKKRGGGWGEMYITEEINIKSCLPPKIEPGHSVFIDLCVST